MTSTPSGAWLKREPARPTSVAHETRLALRNGAMLLASLAGTLGVAVAVRIWMPRYLGPTAFGRLAFAEEFAAASLLLTSLGVEIYIKKEVATRPEHASDFFGGLIQVRLVASALVMLGMAGLLTLMGKPSSDWGLVYVFALGQVAFVLNTSLASLLQSVGKVRELAIVNVVSKVSWGLAIVVGLSLGGDILVVPLSFFAAEALKVPVLTWAARHHLGLVLHFRLRPVLGVLAFSLPFYLNQVGHEVYGRLGVTTMSSLAVDAEVGWYGAANHVKTLVLLALPIINAVLLPMSSRLARESLTALNEVMRTAVRIAFILTAPLALILILNADWIVNVLYTSEFAPAARSLRVLAVLIPLSTFCVLSAMHLLQLNRIWTVTIISLSGLAVAAVSNPMLIQSSARLGDGGAGVGAALAAVLTEATVALLMWVSLLRAGSDYRMRTLVLRLAALFAAMAGVHLALAPSGILGMLLDAAVWLVVGTAVGAVPLREIAARVRAARERKGAYRIGDGPQ